MDDLLQAILDGNVDDAKVKLAALTVAQLNALHDGEQGGKQRTTMLAAIDAELKSREGDDHGNQQSSGDGVTGAGGVSASGEQATIANRARAQAAAEAVRMRRMEMSPGEQLQRQRTAKAPLAQARPVRP